MKRFIETIWAFYRKNRRDMPWRINTSPYYIAVSEIMLQQTQVDRVIKKFQSFITQFPDWNALKGASTSDVLREWSGLGYNRRALYLKRIAETIEGTFPNTYAELRTLPGIGPNTAGSILAFAYNIPHPFIETNIRSVYIHFFFPRKKKVRDTDILRLVQESLDDPKISENPREWYWALMDYGSYLKKQIPNPSRRSTHHTKQKPFKGSNREVRSKILKLLLTKKRSIDDLARELKPVDRTIIVRNVQTLTSEGFIRAVRQKPGLYQIA